MDELRGLNNQINKKKDEINDFLRENSLYDRALTEINIKQRELNRYEECDEWREN